MCILCTSCFEIKMWRAGAVACEEMTVLWKFVIFKLLFCDSNNIKLGTRNIQLLGTEIIIIFKCQDLYSAIYGMRYWIIRYNL